MSEFPRILITPGEPAGVGPDITIQIAQQSCQIAQQSWPAELIVIADPDLLTQRAKQLNLPLKLIEANINDASALHQPGSLKIIPVKLATPVQAGILNPENSAYVLETLQIAAEICLKKKADAIATGPVNKSIINQAGMPFTGHTEFFAEKSHAKHTVMLFVVDDKLKVALATTHLPLAKVASAITKENLRLTISVLHADLQQKFKINNPRILVCGLNPHAGENGYLGNEEIETITPLLAELRQADYLLDGPLPADTIFTPAHLSKADAVLAMYHDQALPLVKYVGFGHAVNVTLGLPFVRTSVDHGTAVDIAGTGLADAGSLFAAIKLALELS